MSELRPVNNNPNLSTGSISRAGTSQTVKGASFSSYMDGAGSLDAIFERASKKYNISIDLLKAVAKAESSFNPNAVSKAGAQGIMQLMPATARELGVVNSFDPEQNIMGGAKYLSGLLKKYDGDVRLALAAYNAGRGNVKKYGGIPPFKQTQNYVVKVMKYMNEDITIPDSANTVKSAKARQAYQSLQAADVGNDSLLDDIYSGEGSELDALFSYDDYLRLIDILTGKDKEKKEDEDDSKNKKSSIEPIISPSLNLRLSGRDLNRL